MKPKAQRIRLLAAGSVTAAALLLSMVPFNMGGCSPTNVNIGALVDAAGKGIKTASLSEKDEDSLGQSVALQATNRYPVYADATLNRYVTLVGRTVGAASPVPKPANHPYYFAVLDTQDVNAFSGPGGYVFITRGAVQRMQDESELAGVLGHEIGHVVKHHGLNAVRSAGTADALLTGAKGADQRVGAFGNSSDALSVAILNKGFGQPQEEEADAEGVKYLIAAGYDPNGYLRFLQRLKGEQKRGGNPFGTHPGIGDRIQKVAAQIQQSGVNGGATLADRFAQNTASR